MTVELFTSIFHFAFPLLMVGIPVVFALIVRTKPHATLSTVDQSVEVKKRTAYLVLATAATMMLHLAVWFLWTGPGEEFKRWTWVFVLPLWYRLAQPLLQAKDSGWTARQVAIAGSPDSIEPVRVAGLTARDRVSSVPRWAWIMAWSAWAVMVTTSLLMLSVPQYPLLIHPLIGGLSLLFVGLWAMRFSATEPEPLDPGRSRKLAAAYERFRRQKQWAWFALSVSAMLVLSVPTLSVSLMGMDAVLFALWFGLGGSAIVGVLGGGGFGVWRSLQRAKLNRMFQQACAAKQSAAS